MQGMIVNQNGHAERTLKKLAIIRPNRLSLIYKFYLHDGLFFSFLKPQ